MRWSLAGLPGGEVCGRSYTLFQKMILKTIQTMAKITPTMASVVYTANRGMGMS